MRIFDSCVILYMHMIENIMHYRTCVCNINYHMVWSVKYRRKILDPEIEEYLQELVQQISEDKGITGRKLFERFLEIRNQLWKGELWNHSYYVETVGSVSEENIRRYIENQSKSY